MQHLPHPNNIGGRLFTDRRHNINNNNIQCLKCPRCDSSNTKFCYYNNYNLSQPRHFCKNCRRYWTKGGVLRNVPVGGGCRKSKRANKPKQKRPASPGLNPVSQHPSRSSSESSSNVHNASVSTVDNGGVFRVSDANVVDFSVRNSGENQEKSSNNGDNNGDNNNNTMVLSGEFMNLITNENNQFFDCLSNNSQNLPTTSFNQFLQTNTTPIGGVNDWSSGVHQVEKDKIGGISDLTVTIEDLDWQHPTAENGSQGLFDFTSTVDHQNYWSQPMSTLDWSHNANDHSLFLP